jgi:hypothetical protein
MQSVIDDGGYNILGLDVELGKGGGRFLSNYSCCWKP